MASGWGARFPIQESRFQNRLWLQGQLSLSSFRGRLNEYQNSWGPSRKQYIKLPVKKQTIYFQLCTGPILAVYCAQYQKVIKCPFIKLSRFCVANLALCYVLSLYCLWPIAYLEDIFVFCIKVCSEVLYKVNQLISVCINETSLVKPFHATGPYLDPLTFSFLMFSGSTERDQ